LTHQFVGRRNGGFAMTYSTLASIVKYPYSSELSGEKGKFGFFVSEENNYKKIAGDLGILQLNENPLKFVRYPLVYLVEAADDICYQIMDIEDAHKLKIISTDECIGLFLNFFADKKRERISNVMEMVGDTNEKIAYLRSSVIGLLIDECSRIFLDYEADILKGEFQGALINHIEERAREAYKECSKMAYARIYRSKDVLDIELAGYRIIGFLLDGLLDAVLNPDKEYSKLLKGRIPEQYETNAQDKYTRIQSVIDYISGMTDIYALDLYRKITGMNLPTL
jgi:dGTPase